MSKFLAGEQYNIIQKVFSQIRYNPERVYIIGTQTDLFNNPPQDWKYQKDEWIKYFETASGYGSKNLAAKNIIGISAGVHLFLLDNKTFANDTDEMDDLRVYARKYNCLNRHDIEATCKSLYHATGINSLWNIIQKNLSHNHHFKWWFGLALIRADYMLAQKGGYRKHCYWSAYSTR